MNSIIWVLDRNGIYHFVSDFKKGNWFKKDRASYSLDINDAMNVESIELRDAIIDKAEDDFLTMDRKCVEKEYFIQNKDTNMFWVICRNGEDGKLAFYNDSDIDGKPTYTNDMTDVRMILAKSSAEETLRTIQQSTRDRVWVQQIYMNLINELIKPNFIITCMNRKTEAVKFFAGFEDDENRLRLVKTSEYARKLNYEDMMTMFEHLRTHNKNFLYSVFPKFEDNVHCTKIGDYIVEKNIKRTIAMDFKLRHIVRN